jgi:hypothetical protein
MTFHADKDRKDSFVIQEAQRMSNDPFSPDRFHRQARFDIPSSSVPQPSLPPRASSAPPTPREASESFQYASCPHCHSHRAKLTKYTNTYKTFFSINCPYCGYNDNDVLDY